MLPVVVVTRVATELAHGAPTSDWTAARLVLLDQLSGPSVRRLPGSVAWVWLCAASRAAQLLEAVGSIEGPAGGIHVVTVKGMFDRPDRSETEQIHPDATDVLTFRLDSDDALIPAAVSSVSARPHDERTMFDLAYGYQMSASTGRLVAIATAPSRQGPFLARVNHGRDDIVNVGGNHLQAREGRTVVRVTERAWIQLIHDGNISNQLRKPKPLARLRRLRTQKVGAGERAAVLAATGVRLAAEAH